MTESSLHFIVSSGPKLQNDPMIRTLIRKQAMKDVALARRKRGNHGRTNLGQIPAPVESVDAPIWQVASPGQSQASCGRGESTSTTTSDGEAIGQNEEDQVVSGNVRALAKEDCSSSVSCFSAPMVPFFTEYEMTCSKFDISVIDLSMLTSWNVGKHVIAALAADPSRLVSLMGWPQWSYFVYIPSRYGINECLTIATDCLLAKVRSIISPGRSTLQQQLKLYARALRSLQAALQDDKLCMESDVLCASQLLGLHELLDSSGDAAWTRHLHGSVRLMKHRTPDRFHSDFDKALFAAQIGPNVLESLRNDKHCFLAAPRWKQLYQSIARQSDCLDNRSPLTVGLRSRIFNIPGLWYDLDKVVKGHKLFDDDALALLNARCREIHQGLCDWLEDYKTHCARLSLISPSHQELAMRRELLGYSLECIAVVKRLWATICDKERMSLESGAQDIALKLIKLQQELSLGHGWLFSSHEIGIAESILSTRIQWGESLSDYSQYERRLAARTNYTEWSTWLRTYN